MHIKILFDIDSMDFGGDIDVFNRFWQETDTVERTNDRDPPSISSLFNDLDEEWNANAENTRNPIQILSGSGEIDLLDIENEFLGHRMNREMQMMSSMFRLEVPNASDFGMFFYWIVYNLCVYY